jgi:hypothetical protein
MFTPKLVMPSKFYPKGKIRRFFKERERSRFGDLPSKFYLKGKIRRFFEKRERSGFGNLLFYLA